MRTGLSWKGLGTCLRINYLIPQLRSGKYRRESKPRASGMRQRRTSWNPGSKMSSPLTVYYQWTLALFERGLGSYIVGRT